MIISGIYMIKNIRTHKIYVGSSIDLRTRMYEHVRQLEKGVHSNIYLQRDFDKKQDNLVHCIIEFIGHKEDLVEREQYWIDFYKSYEKERGYNMCRFAGNTLGRKPSFEARQKMSMKRRGAGNGMYGKTHTPQVKEKLARLRREMEITPEFRSTMSEVTAGKRNGMYGKKHSEETREKLRQLRREKPTKGEKNGMYGVKHTDEAIAKMRKGREENPLIGEKNGMYGKQHSEKAKRKISASKKGVPSKKAKIPRTDYITIKMDIESKKKTVKQIAAQYGVQALTVYRVLRAVR